MPKRTGAEVGPAKTIIAIYCVKTTFLIIKLQGIYRFNNIIIYQTFLQLFFAA